MNQDIKDLMKRKRMYHRELAAALQISEITLCRWLQKELSEDKRTKIMKVINDFKIE